MNFTFGTVTVICFAVCAHAIAADWGGIPVPADPGTGFEWELQAISEDFSYTSAASPKTQDFTDKWIDHYINSWQGPGLTDWDPNYSCVENGNLKIKVARKPGTNEIYAGAISSHETFTYPVFVEVFVKINKLTMASAVWMLSADSTEEIDIVEAYGSDRPDQTWYAQRMHLSHHVFIRDPFQDYQPTDPGTWHYDGTTWADSFRRIGVYWRDPWHLEYYIDGDLVRTVSGESIIDPLGYTGGTGLSKPMHIIIDTEDQNWRSDSGITPTDAELLDPTKNTMLVDWIRVYKKVPKRVRTHVDSSGSQLTLNFSDGQPSLYYDLQETSDLASASWTTVESDLQFNAQGQGSVTRPISSSARFYRIEYLPIPPLVATFDWEEYAGNWWEGYNYTETANGITLVAGGRAAVHDGGDGVGGANGHALKANYPADASPGTFKVQQGPVDKDFRVQSIDISAEEGAQPGSVYLEGKLDDVVQWTIDPTNTDSLQTYTSASTGDLSLLIDQIVWHGPTATGANPGGTLWDNSIDNLTVSVPQ